MASVGSKGGVKVGDQRSAAPIDSNTDGKAAESTRKAQGAALEKLEALSSMANSNASVTVADTIPVNYNDGFLKY